MSLPNFLIGHTGHYSGPRHHQIRQFDFYDIARKAHCVARSFDFGNHGIRHRITGQEKEHRYFAYRHWLGTNQVIPPNHETQDIRPFICDIDRNGHLFFPDPETLEGNGPPITNDRSYEITRLHKCPDWSELCYWYNFEGFHRPPDTGKKPVTVTHLYGSTIELYQSNFDLGIAWAKIIPCGSVKDEFGIWDDYFPHYWIVPDFIFNPVDDFIKMPFSHGFAWAKPEQQHRSGYWLITTVFDQSLDQKTLVDASGEPIRSTSYGTYIDENQPYQMLIDLVSETGFFDYIDLLTTHII